MILVVLAVNQEIQKITIVILVNQVIIKYLVMKIIVILLQKFPIILIMKKNVLVIKNVIVDAQLVLKLEMIQTHIVQNVHKIIILFIIIHIIVLK